MRPKHRNLLISLYVLATVQLVWCYLWITRPYVNTALYEAERERMPFQGRLLMMVPLRLAHSSTALQWVAAPLAWWPFWFPKQVRPEVLVQAAIGILSLLVTGYLTTRIYQASSRRGLLTPVIYPLLLVACASTYMLHTVQNFRFVYDLPSLAFFAGGMYLLYFRRHPAWFALLFIVATINRETTLLLLPLVLINGAVEGGRLRWRSLVRGRSLALVLPLLGFWIGWQLLIRHLFAANPSEFYPRLDWNVKSLLAPLAWPQLLSACGYLLLFVVLMRRHIPDARLRAWLWVLPLWIAFMFAFGILIETRVFGELIPWVVCSTTLILEEVLVARMRHPAERSGVLIEQQVRAKRHEVAA